MPQATVTGPAKRAIAAARPNSAKPAIPVALYKLGFQSQTDIHLPALAGSTWRGVLGHALKRAVCVNAGVQCNQCLLAPGCTYAYIFETPPPAHAQMLRRYPAAPHPFIIRAKGPTQSSSAARNRAEMTFILIGRGNEHINIFVKSLVSGAAAGVGNPRRALRIVSVRHAAPAPQPDWQPVNTDSGGAIIAQPATAQLPPLPSAVRMELLTPLRVKRDGNVVTPAALESHDLLRALLRRTTLLHQFHTDAELKLDFKTLTAQAREITMLERHLQWRDWARYSSRQDKKVPMGGIVGSFSISADQAQPFWPLLWQGQWLHIGKGASMGLGQYRVAPLACDF